MSRSGRGGGRVGFHGAAILTVILIAATLMSGCAGVREAGHPEVSPNYIRVSVYLTDTLTAAGVNDATVTIGEKRLIPKALPEAYEAGSDGLYVTEDLTGGGSFFRAQRAGYRTLGGRLFVPYIPEQVLVRDGPVVLELGDVMESPEDSPSLRTLILWQKYRRDQETGLGKGAPHGPMPGRAPKGYSGSRFHEPPTDDSPAVDVSPATPAGVDQDTSRP